jgi:hypothetical protein
MRRMTDAKPEILHTPRSFSRRSFIVGALLISGAQLSGCGSVTGGDGPFRSLDWHGAQYSGDTWQMVSRDESAGMIPKSWRKIGIFAADLAALDEQVSTLGGQQAVAYKTSDTEAQVGVVDSGAGFFNINPKDPEQYAIGMRVGPGDLRAQMGVWVAKSEIFVPSSATTVLNPITTTDRLLQDFPGVSYV